MKNFKHTFTYFLLLVLGTTQAAERIDLNNCKHLLWKGNFELSVYTEAYYQYDLNNPANGLRPSFVYSHHRNNMPNINLAFVKWNYSSQRLKANVAIMGGTYTVANMVNEPTYLRQIFEANFGFNFLRSKQLWFDVGIFPSHIGFESAIAKDCRTLTRSMLADNSPYFETGAKLTYVSANGNFSASALVLNGWQRMQWIKGNTLPSFGWQVQGKPNSKLLINSSGFVGTDKPDVDRKLRLFHDFFVLYQPIEKLGIILGFDVGAEQAGKNSRQYNCWYSPVLILHTLPVKQLGAAVRFEFYSDKNKVLIATPSFSGFQTFGYSLNVDVLPFEGCMIRAEGKLLQSISGNVFEKRNGSFSSLSTSFVLSFSYSFLHLFK